MVVLLFSLSVHESAHAWTSNYFGDDLARLQGRISLNPAVHIDPIGTLLLPAIAFFTHAPVFGWAKPTPVNPLRWRQKDLANVMVSIAGILANILLATIAFIVIKVLLNMGYFHTGEGLQEPVALFLDRMLSMNISLAVFNLLPFPPLDGSKVLESILPQSMQPALEMLERFGFVILMVLLWTGFFGMIINPILNVVYSFL